MVICAYESDTSMGMLMDMPIYGARASVGASSDDAVAADESYSFVPTSDDTHGMGHSLNTQYPRNFGSSQCV